MWNSESLSSLEKPKIDAAALTSLVVRLGTFQFPCNRPELALISTVGICVDNLSQTLGPGIYRWAAESPHTHHAAGAHQGRGGHWVCCEHDLLKFQEAPHLHVLSIPIISGIVGLTNGMSSSSTMYLRLTWSWLVPYRHLKPLHHRFLTDEPDFCSVFFPQFRVAHEKLQHPDFVCSRGPLTNFEGGSDSAAIHRRFWARISP